MSYKPVFRYKLKGLDEEFSNWTGKSKIEFTRLPYGKYSFLVQTKDIYNNLSPVTEYNFEIRPPWYLSEIALISYAFLFVLGLVFLRVAFKRRLKKHAIELEQREKERRRREQMLVEQKYMRLKNRDLQSEVASKSIELANYTMTMINKNEILLKIKNELQKLKKELGPRFPAYKYKKLNKMLEQSLSSEDEWKKFEFHFDQAHENFFKRLKSEYPQLTPNDLKLCAYLRMNLSTKEIAPLLNISIRGVEVRRYRLRKRLNLKREDNLVEFLMGF
ncbi:MAG: triple tyrosine motif-containing protein [Bacteroidales bacterium]